jgi:Tol biopolymer transport system component
VTLAAGTRLGPYEILSPLGAGGMGEVYRARDSKLGREIAVKVLPGDVASDSARRQRFEQEARSASALNHPNILTIHDIAEADGTLYIAMELVEGKTLRELIVSADPLPTRKLLDIAVQTAEGLSKAHAAGIVHRDLKPENLMVSKDGYVKILDFGLAKLTEAVSEQASVLPTAVAAPTQPGTVMGTAGYMSPEQASGQTVDFRSDQFSLGSILYEMATGKKAFQRKTGAETLAAIIREEPDPLGQLAPKAPAPVRWAVERCLSKDPEERYASTKDLARDLRNIRDHLTETSVSGGLEAAVSPKAKRRVTVLPLATAIAVAVGLLAGREIWKTRLIPEPSYHRLTYRRGFVTSGRFAPDGHTVFYSAIWDGAEDPQYFSTRLENPGALLLDLPAGNVESISRSGEMLILSNTSFSSGYTHRGVLRTAPLSGGAARDLFEDVNAGDWSPDGKSLALVRAPGWRYRLEYPVGKILYETSGWISHPRVSPQGDVVAFLDHPQFGDDAGSVALVDRNGKKTTLSDGWSSAQGLAWAPSGEEVWFSAIQAGNDRALYAVTRAGSRRLVVKSPGVLTLEDISGDGRVLLDHANDRIGLVGLGADAKPRNLSWLDWSRGPILSEDGGILVFTEEGAGGGPGYSVYLRKTDGSPAVRLGEGEALALSPDGKWVLASLPRLNPTPLILLPTGAGEPRGLPKDAIHHDSEHAAFSSDGRRIVFLGSELGRGRRTWTQDLDAGKARPVTPEGVVGTLLSPDGRYVAARGQDQKVALYPVDGGPPHPIEGLDPGDSLLRWSADQRYLYVSGERGRGVTAKVFRIEASTGRRELWKEFSFPDPTGVSGVRAGAITPDGKTFVFGYRQHLSDLYAVDGLK